MQFTTFIAAASAFLLLPTIIASPITSPLAPAGFARRDRLLNRNAADMYFKDDDDNIISGTLEMVFNAIEQIPDEVLEKGDDETDKWMVEHGYRAQADKREVLDIDLESRDALSCACAITKFVATNIFAAAKILRVKKYIDALGGVRRAAELLLRASTRAEKLRIGGEALVQLAKEIFGTQDVADKCS
jgi:hypothetical protein